MLVKEWLKKNKPYVTTPTFSEDLLNAEVISCSNRTRDKDELLWCIGRTKPFNTVARVVTWMKK